jgi:rubrerythrin
MNSGPKSEQNLKDAFAGESQANRKYLAFAKQAEKEGFPQVAKLFRAAAEAETVHAQSPQPSADQSTATSQRGPAKPTSLP